MTNPAIGATISPELGAIEDRSEWLAERVNYLGGTDISAILGLNPYSSPLKVYHEKKGLKEPDPMNDAMQAGIDLEPYLAARFARETGLTLVRSRTYRDPERPYLGVNPDYEILEDPDALVEIKTAGFWVGKDFGEKGTDELPEQYLVQAMWQLAVTGKKTCYLVVLIAGQDFRRYKVERLEPMIQKLRFHADKFWNEYILGECPPPLSGHDYDSKFVSGKHPEDLGEVAEADERITDIVGELASQIAILKKAEAEVERLKTEIKAFMGSAGVLETCYGRFTWRKSKDGEKVDWKALVRGLCPDCRVMMRSVTTPEVGNRPFLTPFSKGDE